MYSYHFYSVWMHFIMHFQWYMIFIFHSVPTPYSDVLLQLGMLQSNYWGTGLLENLAGDMTGEKSCSQGSFGSEVLLERAVNRVLAELGF